jgi:hypothetical protein
MTYNIFDRLGFSPSLNSEVIEYSDTTINRLNSMPKLLSEWQLQDMSNNNSSAYFINPANTHIVSLKDNILSIETLCTGVSNLTTIFTAANNVITSNNLIDFSLHTDRLSNVLEPSVDEELPHYKTAISLGKILTYLLYQSDGVTNNSVLIGSFGSILKYNTVSQYSQTISNDKILIQNSISNGSSNLTTQQKTAITSNINAMNTFVYTTMTEDKNFYANSKTLVAEYSTLRELNSMGQTQNNLILNYIGSEKLIERLNS